MKTLTESRKNLDKETIDLIVKQVRDLEQRPKRVSLSSEIGENGVQRWARMREADMLD